MADEAIETDAEAISQVLRYLLEDECIDIDYERIIEADRQTGWEDPTVALGFRQYTYQACTQVNFTMLLFLRLLYSLKWILFSSVGITRAGLVSNHTVQVSQLSLYSKPAKMSSVMCKLNIINILGKVLTVSAVQIRPCNYATKCSTIQQFARRSNSCRHKRIVCPWSIGPMEIDRCSKCKPSRLTSYCYSRYEEFLFFENTKSESGIFYCCRCLTR